MAYTKIEVREIQELLLREVKKLADFDPARWGFEEQQQKVQSIRDVLSSLYPTE